MQTSAPQGEPMQEPAFLPPRRCHCRVYNCCCCVPLPHGTVAIGVMVLVELIASLLMQDWISMFLQGILLVFFLVALCKRHSENVRQVLY
jgi:hypothetical protein